MDHFISEYLDRNTLLPRKKVPTRKIRQRLLERFTDQKDGRKVLVLFLNGSFNPVHREHITMMESAKNYLESKGFLVAGGYLSPSSQRYVDYKKGTDAISLHKRAHLCALACQDSDWLDATRLGIGSSTKAANVIMKTMNETFSTLLKKRNFVIEVVQVFGTDTLIRLGMVERSKKGKFRHGVGMIVGVDRPGEGILKSSDVLALKKNGILIAPRLDIMSKSGVSSSQILKWIHYKDIPMLSSALHPSVRDALLLGLTSSSFSTSNSMLNSTSMKPKKLRIVAAKETLNIIAKKMYTSPSGRNVTVDTSSLRTTIHRNIPYKSSSSSLKDTTTTYVEVINESTLTCAMRLVKSGKFKSVCALNFASAKNAGGGFLRGSEAQEESIARSSTIISSLKSDEAQKYFYRTHKKNPRNGLYSDCAIHTQDVVVFRDDRHMNLLEEPFKVSFVTCAAVNMGHYIKCKGSKKSEGEKAMRNRMIAVLKCMKSHGHDAVVLGAFGCGVFRNDPNFVASTWKHLLKSEEFNTCFQHVSFAIISDTRKNKKKCDDDDDNETKKKKYDTSLDCFRKAFGFYSS